MTFPADGDSEDLLDFSNEGWCHLLLACLLSGWQWCTHVFLLIAVQENCHPLLQIEPSRPCMCWVASASSDVVPNAYILCWILASYRPDYGLHQHWLALPHTVRISNDFSELGILHYCHWWCACPCHRKSFTSSTLSFQLLQFDQISISPYMAFILL
jgi:hypothetical protein